MNGGGYADTASTTLTVLNGFFLDNNAGNSGGGLAAFRPLIALTNTTVGGNTSYTGGGVNPNSTGTTTVTDSSILGNTAETNGGGIDTDVLELVVTGSTVADNRNLYNEGGGLYSSTVGDGSAASLIQILQGSLEYRDIEATLLVQRYLGRTPSPTEQANVANYLASATPEKAAAIFINSAEFFQDYGNNTDVFLQAIYQTVLGRSGGSTEVAGWTNALGNGLSTAAFVNLALSSTEYLTDTISSDFLAYVGRLPVPAEAAAFLHAAQLGYSDPALAALILGSGEAFAGRT